MRLFCGMLLLALFACGCASRGAFTLVDVNNMDPPQIDALAGEYDAIYADSPAVSGVPVGAEPAPRAAWVAAVSSIIDALGNFRVQILSVRWDRDGD